MILGVGEFTPCDDGWHASPAPLQGAGLKIEADNITPDIQKRACYICENWQEILSTSVAYIEKQREEYGLSALSFIKAQPFELTVGNWDV